MWVRVPPGAHGSFYFVARLRGVSQYGDLQAGQTRGSAALSRGTHSWSHRSQRNPGIWIFATPDTLPEGRPFGYTLRCHTLCIYYF